ncbi:MAG TPA: Fis family transcriptional regulator [Gammaproteobacteria bacterium]|jgi:sigma-E factor negative regulatory protein RseC|nr:SoxR reducing system RseC family protein [Gammaproteobacteria bacterium]HAY41171.1 Fis family transcriptional regulator [Gammaproteobacteria bacterium]|tara:strand:- start:3618 stop:3992 length:375 start_codon:yes stop_codon:yes gene_type:complete
MKEKFEVINVNSETMTLKINRSDTCHSCSAKGGCGTGILTSYFDKYSVFERPSKDNVLVGDFVTLEIPSREIFFRAFVLYILPLIMLFFGGYLGLLLFPFNEVLQILFGFFGFISTLLLVKLYY